MITALLAVCAALCLAFSQWLIYFYAPIEAQMGLIQKIFYIHLPLAWWALVSFAVVFATSLLFLISKRERYASLAGAAAELGVLFSGIALVTGMIWAKKSWGVWWTWDPRLATTLVMWFLYCGYLILRGMDWPAPRKNTICAVFGIMAFLDVPLVFLSARIFRTIHPAVFASSSGGLVEEMRLTAITSVAAFGLMWLALLILRYQQIESEKICASRSVS